jgi:hypothetical protein
MRGRVRALKAATRRRTPKQIGTPFSRIHPSFFSFNAFFALIIFSA